MSQDDFREQYERLRRLVADGEPPELRGFLANPESTTRPRALGSVVPLIGHQMTQRGDGLIVPVRTLGGRLAESTIKFMTATEVFGKQIPSEISGGIFIGAHDPDEVLGACAQIMGYLYFEASPTDQQLNRALVQSFLANEARDRAIHLLDAEEWIFLAPQAVLAVAKLAITIGRVQFGRTPDQALGDAVAATLAMAAELNVGPQDENEPTVLNSISRSLVMDLVANQLFNRTLDLGTELARWMRTRELARSAFPIETQRFDSMFLQATGTTPDVLFDVSLALLLVEQQTKIVRIDRGLLSQLNHPKEQIESAIHLISSKPDDGLASTIRQEDSDVGHRWAYNWLRASPVIVDPNDNLLILGPPFLIERSCGNAFHLVVKEEINRQEYEGDALAAREAERLRGQFGWYLGHVAEEYALDRLSNIASPCEGLQKRLWRESELKTFWRTGRCCDALIDEGDCWIAVEVVSHRVSKPAAEGGDWDVFQGDVRMTIEDKVPQLDATIGRLIPNGGALPGQRVRTPVPRYQPVIVAAHGFPFNAVIAETLLRRIKELALLENGLIWPLCVISIDDVEHLESIVASGGATLGQIFRERFERDEYRTPMDYYLSRRHGLWRPKSLHRSMVRAFEQTGKALGLDIGLLSGEGPES